MASTLSQPLTSVIPRSCGRQAKAGLSAGESDRKKLVGAIVERAIELMKSTKYAAAIDMGYADQGVISRWCSGLERPHIDKLIGLPGFAGALIIALAERPEIDPLSIAEVQTVVKVRRRA